MIGEDGDSASKEKRNDDETEASKSRAEAAETAANSLLGKNIDSSCYRYEDNKCFYVDPTSGTEFEWNEEKKEWTSRSSQTPPNFTTTDYKFDGETYFYTDDKSKTTYKWDKSKKEWEAEREGESEKGRGESRAAEVKKKSDSDGEEFDEDEARPEVKRQDMTQGVYGFDGHSHTYTDSSDGTVYIWDNDKSAWFPKVDDDFLARYQMSYGFSDPQQTPDPQETPDPQQSPDPAPQLSKEGDEAATKPETLKRKQEASWFEVDAKSNTKVYVSNLPLDLTEKELVDLMQKCGLLMKEDSSRFKVKMYSHPHTNTFKGDALCTYIKVESVELALSILDGYEMRGKKICVERATFKMKGDYDPSLKPKKKSKKQMEKLKKMQQKLFDWRPDKLRGEREKHERVVIISNLFVPSQFDRDVGLILEYQQDLREEASKCGNVKKVTIFDRHPEGVAQILFREAEAADACIQLLNNRWFGQRQLTAHTWDGKTKYTVAETEEQKEERLNKWQKFIEEDESKQKRRAAVESHHSDEETRSSAGSADETDDESTAGIGTAPTDSDDDSTAPHSRCDS